MIDLVKNKHYQVACQRYFISTHPGSPGDGVGNHPNAYFEISERYYAPVVAAAITTTASTPTLKIEGN